MLKISCFKHEDFTSNTYLLTHPVFEQDVYLIDIGNSKAVLNALRPHQQVKGVFLTHAHYDHIYGINEILEKFPKCKIYCSEYAHHGLKSEKLNLSFYHDYPVVYKGENVNIVSDNMLFELFLGCRIRVLETQGHNQGSLSFMMEKGIFTGDSLIPGFPVVTKLKSGNKEDALKSIHRIREVSEPDDMLYPGHASACKISEIDWNFYLNNGRN